MSTLTEARTLLQTLTPGEKAALLQTVAHELTQTFPGIDSDPQICGGAARLSRTRIPIWTLARSRQLGISEADLLHAYPTLRAEDLANAWSYERAHREEIETAIRENEVDE